MSIAAVSGVVESFRYWDVLRNFFLLDLRIKYRGTIMGYFWSLLNPVLQMAVLSLVFSVIMRVEAPNYPIYLFSGFVAWNFFNNAVTSCSRIYLENSFFLKKVYLPKLVFPFSRFLLSLFDFSSSLVGLGLLGLLIGLKISASFVMLPLAMLSMAILTLGVVILVATATVFFRDSQYLVGVFIQILYFLTPVLYLKEMIPEAYRPFFAVNPLYWQVNLFQNIIYHNTFPSLAEWGAAFGFSAAIFAVSVLVNGWLEDRIVFRL